MQTKPLSILIADDDIEDVELFKETILAVEPKASITAFLNGSDIIFFLGKCHDLELPNLIILDYNMPQMTGLDVLSALNKNKRYNAVTKLILSTSSSKLHKKECLDNGAKEYFVKPGNIKELEALAKKMISIIK